MRKKEIVKKSNTILEGKFTFVTSKPLIFIGMLIGSLIIKRYPKSIINIGIVINEIMHTKSTIAFKIFNFLIII